MKTSYGAHLLALCGEDSAKEQWPLQHLCLGESCLSSSCHYARQLGSSPFGPSDPALELRASESKQIHAGSLRGMPGTLEALHLTRHNLSWFLHPESMGTSLPDTETQGLGPGVGLALITPQ